jgi:ABC-type amino acid transport substrate-binding protein
MTDFPFSQRMLKTTDWARLVTPPTTYHITPYAWAVKPGDDAWLDRVNLFLSKSKTNGSLKQAAQRHGLTPIVLLD